MQRKLLLISPLNLEKRKLYKSVNKRDIFDILLYEDSR